MIFEEAASSLQDIRFPTAHKPAHTGGTCKTHMQNSSRRFGHIERQSRSLEIRSPSPKTANADQEPPSSGYVPSFRTVQPLSTPDSVQESFHDRWHLPRRCSSSMSLDSDECHSTHGVPLIMPFSDKGSESAQKANVDAWLNDIDGKAEIPCPDATTSEADVQGIRLQQTKRLKECHGEPSTPLRTSSNKENVSPMRDVSSPLERLSQDLSISTPLHLRNPRIPLNMGRRIPSATRFPHPCTPQGHLSLPPRRKRARTEDTNPQDFTIREDELSHALANLSPSVERHRKGDRPRRERCHSYWDDDILEPGSPGHRRAHASARVQPAKAS